MAGLNEVLTAQAAVIEARTDGEVGLGEDLHAFSALSLQRVTEHGFGSGTGIDICRIESGDTRIQGCMHTGVCLLFFNLGTVGDPVAVGDLADGKAAAAKASKLHTAKPSN